MMSLTAGLTGKPPNQVDEHRQCSVGDHRGMAVARVEAQTEAVALQLGRYRHNIHWWASSPSLWMRMATVVNHNDRDMTNNHHT